MEPVEYLFAISGVRSDMARKRTEIVELRSIASSTGAKLDGERVQSSGAGDKVASMVSKIIDAEHELAAMESSYCDILDAVNEFIGTLEDPDERLVLTLRVVGRRGNSRSALELSKSGRLVQERQERRIYKSAKSHINQNADTEEYKRLTNMMTRYNRRFKTGKVRT